MNGNLEDWREFLFWCGRIALCRHHRCRRASGPEALWRGHPIFPEDPVLALHWRRRRRQYVALAELSALPAFATISVVLVSYQQLDPVAAVLLSLAQGFCRLPPAARWRGLPVPAQDRASGKGWREQWLKSSSSRCSALAARPSPCTAPGTHTCHIEVIRHEADK